MSNRAAARRGAATPCAFRKCGWFQPGQKKSRHPPAHHQENGNDVQEEGEVNAIAYFRNLATALALLLSLSVLARAEPKPKPVQDSSLPGLISVEFNPRGRIQPQTSCEP